MSDKTELESLQERANLMGIKFHPNCKEEALRNKIQAVLEGTESAEEASDDPDDIVDDEEAAPIGSMPNLGKEPEVPGAVVGVAKVKLETKEEKSYRLRLAGTKLVRVFITCRNPMKKDWQGEQFTVSNRNIGTINRFVPFEQEWHVEAAILDMLRDRQYLGFNTRKVGAMKMEVKEPKMLREFAIEVLEPLTDKQLRELAIKQAVQGGDTDAASDLD